MATETSTTIKDSNTGAQVLVDGVLVPVAPPVATTGQSIRQAMTLAKSDGTARYADPDGAGNLSTHDVVLELAQTSDGSTSAFLSGNPNGDFANIDLLDSVMDNSSGLGLNVNIIGGGPRVDATGALVASDGATPIVMAFKYPGQQFDIDTLGYETLHISTSAAVNCTIQASNDRSAAYVFSQIASLPISAGTGNSNGALGASAHFVFPCVARWIRIQVTAAGGSAVAYLRAQPFPSPYVASSMGLSTPPINLTQIASTVIAGVGQAGSLPVGGATPLGSTVTQYPLTVGGVDASGFARNLRVTSVGRAQVDLNIADPFGTAVTPGAVDAGSGLVNTPALAVNETAQHEGVSLLQMLSLVLTELRVLNHQMAQLPQILAQPSPTAQDDPDALRSEYAFQTN